jgi:hypothetical protein
MKRNQSAAANMLHFSATDNLSQFLNYSSSENAAYTMIPNSPTATRHNNPCPYAKSPNLSQQETSG